MPTREALLSIAPDSSMRVGRGKPIIGSRYTGRGLTLRIDEHVADLALRSNGFRSRWIVFHEGSQTRDQHAQAVRLGIVVASPDRLREKSLGEDLAGVIQKEG